MIRRRPGSTLVPYTTVFGFISPDVVSCTTGAASFDSKLVGAGKTVTVSGLTLGGTDASNYTLASTSATTTASITTATLTATVTAASKTYDGTGATTATCAIGAGVISPDVVSCTTGAASFDSKLVGAGKTVTVSGLTLGGADAGNYTLASSTATTTAAITAATLTATVTAASKTYDGTGATTATCAISAGVISPDVVSCATGAANCDSKLVGAGKTVTVSGLTLGGADASNYALASTSATTSASITTATLTPTVTAATKTYDGTGATTATCAVGAGVISPDVVSCATG